AERLDQLRQRQPLLRADPVAALHSGLIGRLPPPVRFADQHHPVRGDAPPEKLDSSGNAAAEPGPSHARRDVNWLFGDVARCIAMDEADPVGDVNSSARAWAPAMRS